MLLDRACLVSMDCSALPKTLLWASLLAVIRHRTPEGTKYWLGALTLLQLCAWWPTHTLRLSEQLERAGPMMVGEMLRIATARTRALLPTLVAKCTRPTSTALPMHPVTLCFVDEEHEAIYTAQQYQAAYLPMISLFCAFFAIFTIRLGKDWGSKAIPDYEAMRMFGCAMMIVLMTNLHRHPDQQHARRTFGRAGAVMAWASCVSVISLALSEAPQDYTKIHSATYLLLIMFSAVRFIALRLQALHWQHRAFVLGATLTFHLLLPESSELGRSTELFLACFINLVGEAVGHAMERSLRVQYMQAQILARNLATEPRPRPRSGAGAGASAPPPSSEAATAPAALPEEGSDARQPLISALKPFWLPLTLAFADADLDTEYTAKQVREGVAAALNVLGASTMIVFGLVLGSAGMPRVKIMQLFFSLISFLSVRAVSVLEDVNQIRVALGRFALAITLVTLTVVFLQIHMDYPMDDTAPITLPTFICMRFVSTFVFVTTRFVGFFPEHRFAGLVLTVVYYTLVPRLTHLGKPLETTLTCLALFVGELICLAIDLVMRRFFVTQWDHARRLHSTRADLQRAEQAVQKAEVEVHVAAERAQRDIAAYLYHELRNDANAVVGILDWLVEESDKGASEPCASEPSRQLLLDGQTHAHHMANVIANVLDWSRLKARSLTLPTDQPFNLAVIVNECVRLTRHLSVGKPIELVANVPEEAALLGSPVHLKQILVNLLTNACKYTERGRICISATLVPALPNPAVPPLEADARCEEGEDSATRQRAVTVRFTVEDSGVGVAEEYRAMIFEEYCQGPKLGTGLGLPLSWALVNLMGGELKLLQPSNACGSIFAFTASFRREPLAPPAPACPRRTLPAGLRILVADDGKSNRLLLRRTLGNTLPSPDIIETAHGDKALALLLEDAFEIAFLDEHFAQGEPLGTQITQAVRARARPGRRQPVIIGCTGMEDKKHTTHAIAMGQDAVFGKPMPKGTQLSDAIYELLVQRGIITAVS